MPGKEWFLLPSARFRQTFHQELLRAVLRVSKSKTDVPVENSCFYSRGRGRSPSCFFLIGGVGQWSSSTFLPIKLNDKKQHCNLYWIVSNKHISWQVYLLVYCIIGLQNHNLLHWLCIAQHNLYMNLSTHTNKQTLKDKKY